ncbi:hypothetical protein LTS02_016870 [Friedmanniomyces endolithicus]|nr:hypothetical protein LTS02_016870 [Friedmanniomyces endolithicus]
MEDVPPGHRLMPAAVDYRAQHTPDRVFAILPRGGNLEYGFYNLTYAAFAKAVDATAWWLDEVLGVKPPATQFDDFPTVPYIGPDDFRYILMMLAAMKTGRKVMLPFPANTAEGLVNLLNLSKATVVLAPASHKHIWEKPREIKQGVDFVEVPGPECFLHDRLVEKYDYARRLPEAAEDPAFLVQTSGTTGYPKPIDMNSRLLKEYVEDVAVLSRNAKPDKKIAVYALLEGTTCPNLLPISWAVGLSMVGSFALFANTVPILLPQETAPRPPTPDYIIQMTKHAPKGEKNGLLLTPDILRHLVRVPEGRESLRRYSWVAYAGAPLDHETGDAITAMGIRVQSFIGSTDIGVYNILLNEPQDWKIHRFSKDLHGYFLMHYTDDLHELVVRKQERDPRHVFVEDPSTDTFHCRDLWRAVPGREEFWMNAGRVDDFVKLFNMTKFNAIALEQIVEGHKDVAKCLIAGDARERPFILVEPAAHIERGPDLLSQMLPAIEKANEHLLPEAHLKRDLVLLTDPNRPIVMTGKGTVSRRTTLDLYEEKVEEMYGSAGFEVVPFKATGEAMGQEVIIYGHANGQAK